METGKRILILTAILCYFSVFSQNSKNLGITAGIGYNTQSKELYQLFPVSYAYYNLASPYLGLTLKDSLFYNLHFKTGLYYIQRGVRFNYIFDTPLYYLNSKSKFTGHYLTIPLKLNYYIKKLFFGCGVELSYLMKAHHQVTIEEEMPLNNYVNKNVLDKWYKGGDFYQIIDGGYNINLGYRINNFEIEGSVFHGLLAPPKFDYFSQQHFEYKYKYQETFVLSLTYYFRPIKRKS